VSKHLLIIIGLVLVLPTVTGHTATAADAKAKVTYMDHVMPVFQNHCFGCHNADKKKGDLDLSTYTSLMAGGGSGNVVAAGDAGESLLFKLVAHLDTPKMPPKKPRIPDAQLAIIKNWIDGGLLENAGSKARKSSKPKFDLTLKQSPTGKPTGPPPMPQDLILEPQLQLPRAEAVTALATSPWAPLWAVSGQHQVLLYNSQTLQLAGVLPFPERRPYVLRFSRNGQLLLAGGGRAAKLGRVIVWDVTSGKRVLEIGSEFNIVLAADISPDHGLVALGGPGKLIKIFSTTDDQMLHQIKKHTDWVTSMEFSPDGVLLCTGDRNGGVHVWEAHTGRIFYTLKGHRSAITGISWRSDSNVVATASEDGQVMLWEMHNGRRIRNWRAHNSVLSVAYGKNGYLVTSGRDRVVRMWDGNGAKKRDFDAFSDLALKAAFNHDATRVVGGDWTGELRVWNAADGKRLGTLNSNPPTVVQRVDQAQKQLASTRTKYEQLTKQYQSAQQAAKKATANQAATTKAIQTAQAQIKDNQTKLAAANKAMDIATKALAAGNVDVKARQANQSKMITLQKQAKNAVVKAEAELSKLQQAAATALEQLKKKSGDAALAAKVEAAQKQAAEKSTQLLALTKAAAAAQSNAAKANGELAKANKTLVDRQKAQAQAKATQTAMTSSLNKAKSDLAAHTKALPGRQAAAKAASANAAKVKKDFDAVAAQLNNAKYQIRYWNAARFNLQVHAAAGEHEKLQREHNKLLAAAQDKIDLATQADRNVKAAQQAVAKAPMDVKAAEQALVSAQAEAAKAVAAQQSAQKLLAARTARVQSAGKLAGELAAAANTDTANKTLAAAVVKANEATALLKQDEAAATKALAAATDKANQAQSQIGAAQKSLATAKAKVTETAKQLKTATEAAKQAKAQAAEARKPADAFKPKVDAAKAQYKKLRGEYLKLKPAKKS